MKKFLTLCILAISMTVTVCAQNSGWIYYIGKTKTEQLFDVGNVNWFRHRFVIPLKNGNMVIVQLTDKAEFERLLNLDSVVKSAAVNILLLKDTLQNETGAKRIDYLNDEGKIKIRIRDYLPNGNSFLIDAGEPSLLKIEQDTLNIMGYRSKGRSHPPDIRSLYIKLSYKITVLVNDIHALENLADGTLNTAMQDLKAQWDGLKKWTTQNNEKTNLYAYYNPEDMVLNRPIREPRIRSKVVLEPYVQIGIQNVNNLLATSAGVGLQIWSHIRNSTLLKYQFLWEPYFFFDKSSEGKFAMRRNDFVTFQFISSVTNHAANRQKVEFIQNFSVGYLIHRSGDYFKETTFKAGLPGAHYNVVTLHPEVIFNGLFKNFQPGLKLILDLD